MDFIFGAVSFLPIYQVLSLENRQTLIAIKCYEKLCQLRKERALTHPKLKHKLLPERVGLGEGGCKLIFDA